MRPYLKHFLKNAAVGATTGALFGATCGSGAGIAGLNQMCSGAMDNHPCSSDLQPLIMKTSTNAAAAAGSAVGAAIGFVVGGITYPAYKGIMGWCYPRIQQESVVQEVPSINNNVPIDTSQKVTINF